MSCRLNPACLSKDAVESDAPRRNLSSLPRDPEVEAARDAEIRRRVAELESGAMDTPAEEVFAEARRRLNA